MRAPPVSICLSRTRSLSSSLSPVNRSRVGISSCRSETDPPCKRHGGSQRSGQSTRLARRVAYCVPDLRLTSRMGTGSARGLTLARRLQGHAGAPGLGESDGDRLLGRASSVLAFPDVFHLLPHEFVGRGRRALALAQFLLRSLDGRLVGHLRSSGNAPLRTNLRIALWRSPALDGAANNGRDRAPCRRTRWTMPATKPPTGRTSAPDESPPRIGSDSKATSARSSPRWACPRRPRAP